MRRRAPLSGLAKLTLACFVAIVIATLWKIVFLGGFVPQATASGAVFLATTAGLALARTRWMPALAAAVAMLALAGALLAPPVRYILADPADAGPFATTVIQLVSFVIAAVAGIGATVQRYRQPRTAGER